MFASVEIFNKNTCNASPEYFSIKKTRFEQFLEFCNCVCVETRSQNLRLKYYFLIIKKNTEIMIYITLNWSFGLTNVSIGVK